MYSCQTHQHLKIEVTNRSSVPNSKNIAVMFHEKPYTELPTFQKDTAGFTRLRGLEAV
jgi:hypothetical protein